MPKQRKFEAGREEEHDAFMVSAADQSPRPLLKIGQVVEHDGAHWMVIEVRADGYLLRRRHEPFDEKWVPLDEGSLIPLPGA
jgi:hypothetical protein